VPRKENAELYAKYKALADATPNVHFVGRLATYRYYNMDQIVAQSLTTYAKIRGEKRAVAATASAHVAYLDADKSRGNGAGVGNGHGAGNANGNGNGRHAPSPGLQMSNT
jgi:UDP-galactopyranose mutase